jgi:hypothetical protein
LNKVLVRFLFLFLITNVFSQNKETIQWKNFIDKEISFRYPAFFEINKINDVEKNCKGLVSLNFMHYEPLDEADSDSLEDPSYLEILLCDKDFSRMAKEFGFYEKNGFWYGDSNLIPVSNEEYDVELYAGISINFDDWSGIKAITTTTVFIKSGGIWTAAGERYKFILHKKFANEKFLFAKGYGFTFPQGNLILKEICKSITLINN